jgi:uncharacterized paraquat-inducible protein A
MKNKLPVNPPKYPTMPISFIRSGWQWPWENLSAFGSNCPNCDTEIMDERLAYCEKCHYIFGEPNPRNRIDELKCRTCGHELKSPTEE